MQVNVHSIDRTEVVDFTELKGEDCPPFVAIKVFDGQGGEVAFLLRDVEAARQLMEAAANAVELLWIKATV